MGAYGKHSRCLVLSLKVKVIANIKVSQEEKNMLQNEFLQGLT